MAMELCHVFSRIAAWRTKDDSHAFIQSTFLISKTAEMQHALDGVVRSISSLEKTLGDRGSLRSGKANHGDGAFAGRCRDRCDGVLGKHVKANAFAFFWQAGNFASALWKSASAFALSACRLGRAVFQQAF